MSFYTDCIRLSTANGTKKGTFLNQAQPDWNPLPPLSLRKNKTMPVFPPACPFWPTDGRRGKALPSLSLHLGGRQLGPSFQVELTPVCWMFTTSAQQTRPESPRKVHTLPFVGIFFAESTTSTCSQRPTRSQYGPVQWRPSASHGSCGYALSLWCCFLWYCSSIRPRIAASGQIPGWGG